MMGTYFLWRLSMLLIAALAFSMFVAFYKLANKILRRRKVKECEN